MADSNLPMVNLPPGHAHLARTPTLLTTVLGSCVGATFWSARLRAGALCHGILPHCPQPFDAKTAAAEGFRYVDFSIRSLTKTFVDLGVPKHEIQVKLFGGANVVPVLAGRANRPTVGAMNSKAALEEMEKLGLRVILKDLQGTRGRRIFFDTESGEVFVRWLNHANETKYD